jgi:hypothetical protein
LRLAAAGKPRFKVILQYTTAAAGDVDDGRAGAFRNCTLKGAADYAGTLGSLIVGKDLHGDTSCRE